MSSTSACALALVTPAAGEILDNGCRDRSDLLSWSFAWSGCPEDQGYHLYVMQATALYPAIDRADLRDPSYTHAVQAFTFSTTGWTWKVRRKVAGA